MSSKKNFRSRIVPLEVLGLSIRTYNALMRSGVDSVNKLLPLDTGDFVRIRGIGSKSIAEIENKLTQFQSARGHLNLICGRGVSSTTAVSQKHKRQTSLDVLGLSRRAYNMLVRAGIDSVYELSAIEPEVLLRIRGIGEKTVAEVQDALSRFKADSAELDFDALGLSMAPHLFTKGYQQFLHRPEKWGDTVAARILKHHGIEEEPIEWSWSHFLRELHSWEAVSGLESDIRGSSLPPLDALSEDTIVGKETVQFLLGIDCPLHLIPSSRATSNQLAGLILSRAGINTMLDLCLTTRPVLETFFVDYKEITGDLGYYLHWLASQDDWQHEVAGNQPSPVTRRMLRNASLIQLIETALADNSVRNWEIFAKRHKLAGNEKYTLEDLGIEFSLTRERIRQVVAREERDLIIKVQSDNLLSAVVFICAEVIEEAGVIHLDALVDEIAELIEIDRKGAAPALVVLLSTAGGIEYVRPMRVFLSSHIPSDLILAIQSNLRLAMRQAKAPIRLGDLEIEVLKDMEQQEKNICQRYSLTTVVLEFDPDFTHVEEDYWGLTSWDRRILDDIVMALRSIGEPTHFKELTRVVNRRLPKDQRTTTRAVHAKLGSYKDLFARTGPGTFALCEWDPSLPVQPTKYRDLIRQVLKNAGVPLTADHIYQRVHELRPAKRSSIIMYLTMHEDFTQLGKDRYGLVQWARNEEVGEERMQVNLSREFLDELRTKAVKAFQQQDGEWGNRS